VDGSSCNGPDWQRCTHTQVGLNGSAASTTNSLGIATNSVTAGATPGAAVVRATTPAVAGIELDRPDGHACAGQSQRGNFFFRSVKNAAQDPAIDTAQVGQPVPWTVSGGSHAVRSRGATSFGSSGHLVAGGAGYQVVFSTPGIHQYDCEIHTAVEMNDQVVVLP
jgi:plastocyanin